jgi:hypothetical protein
MELKEMILMGLENVKMGTGRALDGLTPVELKWQQRPDVSPIGLILFHMIHAEDYMIHGQLQGKPRLWESGMWYKKLNKQIKDGGGGLHYTAEQVAAFVVPDIKALIAYADAVRKETIEYLNGLKAEDFDNKVQMPVPKVSTSEISNAPNPNAPRPPVIMTVGSCLVYLVTHLAQHFGEISYLRDLQRGVVLTAV